MLKSYKLFLESSKSENNFEDWKSYLHPEIANICKKYGIKHWVIDKDGLVDVYYGNVNFRDKGLSKIPLKFGRVRGNFSCALNNLTSLEGCPYEVGGDFMCYFNKLVTLKGSPHTLIGNINCAYNELTSLEGCPKEVDGNVYCNYNKIISLDDLGKVISFSAHNNPIFNLTKLGRCMIDNNISFLESVMFNLDSLSDIDFKHIFQNIDAQKILDLNNFKIFNLLRTRLPKKYAEICALRNVDLSTDLGELGF